MKVRSHRVACSSVLLERSLAIKIDYDGLESKQLAINTIYGIIRVIQSIN